MKPAPQLLTIFTTLSASFSHPIQDAPRELTIVGLSHSSKREVAGTMAPEFQLLADGNKVFRDDLAQNAPTLLQTLTDEGQAPPFMFIGCSDSRASEGTIFSARPGTLFTERNIANQFFATDPNTHAVVSYAVAVLNVNHVVVMGHYGCGGVAAAIIPPPPATMDSANGAVQSWIQPIREIFQTSSRPEIVELREKIKGQTNVEEPDIKEPGFRALVEENVKAGVKRLATDSIIANHYAALATASGSPSNTTATPNTKRADHHSFSTPSELYIHGWVYDIETGTVRDLGVSVGPPGKAIPDAPWDAVVGAATSTTPTSHDNVSTNKPAGGEVEKRCEQLCKAKRFFFGRNN